MRPKKKKSQREIILENRAIRKAKKEYRLQQEANKIKHDILYGNED